jgi:TetR/AcrR family transcriptional repressor of nem operon
MSARSSSRTKLLDAALDVFRARGYTATTVDDICGAAGLTKGSFFHHFAGKEELAIATTKRWNEVTGALFAEAPYRRIEDPRDRLLAYLDFRTALLRGSLPEVTCLLGTMVQEVYETHPAIRDACRDGIYLHAQSVADDLAEAKARYAPDADWSPASLAIFTQAVIQGALILAKAQGRAEIAAACIGHLRRYVAGLLGIPQPEREDPS